jgi:hypothetical protein
MATCSPCTDRGRASRERGQCAGHSCAKRIAQAQHLLRREGAVGDAHYGLHGRAPLPRVQCGSNAANNPCTGAADVGRRSLTAGGGVGSNDDGRIHTPQAAVNDL